MIVTQKCHDPDNKAEPPLQFAQRYNACRKKGGMVIACVFSTQLKL